MLLIGTDMIAIKLSEFTIMFNFNSLKIYTAIHFFPEKFGHNFSLKSFKLLSLFFPFIHKHAILFISNIKQV